MSNNYILEGKKLVKHFPAKGGKTLIACNNVDFYLYKGETLGIVGESGCGKSTLMRMVARLEEPTSGELFLNGETFLGMKGKKLRESRKHLQMVFQDPATAFSPRMKVKDALLEPLRNFYKLSKAEEDAKIKELLEQVELPYEYIDRYCHQMSGGQRQRLGIARALAADPEILLCDEATSAVDVSVQDTIIELLVSIQKKRELSVMFVCHDIALVQSLSHRVMVMYLGNVVEVIEGERLFKESCHPYSRLLMASLFSTKMDFDKEIETLAGEVPSPLDVIAGCPFASRCTHVTERCLQEKLELKFLDEHHQVACHLF